MNESIVLGRENDDTETSFLPEEDFCVECGAILKIDHNSLVVNCANCSYESSLKNLIGKKYSYEIEFTPLGYYTSLRKENKEKEKRNANDSEGTGQMDNDRECSKCNHIGMSYTTMQLRSADEGQTVFYFCPKCKHREVENS